MDESNVRISFRVYLSLRPERFAPRHGKFDANEKNLTPAAGRPFPASTLAMWTNWNLLLFRANSKVPVSKILDNYSRILPLLHTNPSGPQRGLADCLTGNDWQATRYHPSLSTSLWRVAEVDRCPCGWFWSYQFPRLGGEIRNMPRTNKNYHR